MGQEALPGAQQEKTRSDSPKLSPQNPQDFSASLTWVFTAVKLGQTLSPLGSGNIKAPCRAATVQRKECGIWGQGTPL